MMILSSKTITHAQLAKVIDHSLLRPELTEADVLAGRGRLRLGYHELDEIARRAGNRKIDPAKILGARPARKFGHR